MKFNLKSAIVASMKGFNKTTSYAIVATIGAAAGFGLLQLLKLKYQTELENIDKLMYPAIFAGLFSALLAWWLIVRRVPQPSRIRGMWAGIFAGFIAHPLCWYFNILRENICYYLNPNCDCDIIPFTPWQGLVVSVVYSYVSWVTYGWLTMGLGGLIGFFIAPIGRDPKAQVEHT